MGWHLVSRAVAVYIESRPAYIRLLGVYMLPNPDTKDIFRPYFKKVENFNEPTPDHQKEHQSLFDPNYHGRGGPIQTSYSATYGASHKYWHTTLNNLGVKTNSSHFSGSNVGCWTCVAGVTQETKERSFSATAYYKPVSERENLILLTEAIAQEVVMEKEGQDWVVKGVRFTHGGEDHVIRLHGEVIISGGSVSSPQLLELSGIGNPKVLDAGGIECKIDNANVGENFQEHMSKLAVRLYWLAWLCLIVSSDGYDLRD